VTGQRGEWPGIVERLEQGGFAARIEVLRQGQSAVSVVVAEKLSAISSQLTADC
jgi:hypothetical protein